MYYVFGKRSGMSIGCLKAQTQISICMFSLRAVLKLTVCCCFETGFAAVRMTAICMRVPNWLWQSRNGRIFRTMQTLRMSLLKGLWGERASMDNEPFE